MNSKVVGAFVGLTLMWGASFLWIKIAVEDIGPYSLVALRLVFGVVGLAPVVLVQRPKLPRDRVTWGHMAFLGLLNSALPWLLISWAELSIDSALATVLNSTVPLFTIVIAHFYIHDDRISWPKVGGLVLGFAGVMALIQRKGGVTDAVSALGIRSDLAGQIAMLVASLLYAFTGVYARRFLRHISPLVQAFFSLVSATVIIWIVFPFVGESLRLPSTPQSWIGVAWLGVLGAGIAGYLFYYLLHTVGPTRASFVTYLIPIVGVALGVIVLNEVFDLYLVLGTVLIVSGVWAVNRKR